MSPTLSIPSLLTFGDKSGHELSLSAPELSIIHSEATDELETHDQPRWLIVRDMTSKNEKNAVHYNSKKPVPISNENCEGQMLFKVKTTPPNPTYAPYFDGRKRVFELQVQVQLKTITENDIIYLGIEGTGHLELNIIARTMSRLVIKVIQTTTPQAHTSLGDAATDEPCHMTMPMAQSVDFLHITPIGQPCPSLGVAEFPEGIPRNNRDWIDTYSQDNIYTLSMHGMYIDWYEWRIINIPGMPSCSLRRFMGDMSISFVAYTIPKGYTGPHNKEIKRYLFNLEMTSIV